MVFYHNINPVAFTIGPIDIRFYGLVYFIGFLFAYFYLRHQVKKNRLKNFGLDDVDSFMIYFMLGSIIGARVLAFVFFNTSVLFSNPLQIFKIWEGGMSIHGGIIGAMFAGWLYVRNKKVRYYALADIIIGPLMIFLGLGRIANFINAEIWGIQSNARFCIDYSKNVYMWSSPEGCRHPYQLYESAKNFLVGISLLIYFSFSKLKEGLLFWYGILAYNVLRFFLDFFRDDPTFLGLNTGQYLCIVFSIVAIFFIVKIKYFDDSVKDLKNEEHNKHKKDKNKMRNK